MTRNNGTSDPERYLDIADTFHDMVKPPTSWTINEPHGRCKLDPVQKGTDAKSAHINNLAKVKEWLEESPDYKDGILQDNRASKYHELILPMGNVWTRQEFLTFLKTKGEADYEYWVMSLYDKAGYEFQGIENRNVKLKDILDHADKLFPDYSIDKQYYLLMDALQNREFFEHYTKYQGQSTDTMKKCPYISCIASDWDQAYKDSGDAYKTINMNFQACGLTGKYVKFHKQGNKNVVRLYRDGVDDKNAGIDLDRMSLSVLNLGVRSLCDVASQVSQINQYHDEQRKLQIRKILRGTLLKTDKNKNGKRVREDGNEPILDTLYEFLVDPSNNSFLYYNLFNIKRSGDYGQIAATQALNTSEERYYLVTIDKLCYLRAKIEKVPCIRVLKDGNLDAYHGEINDANILESYYNLIKTNFNTVLSKAKDARPTDINLLKKPPILQDIFHKREEFQGGPFHETITSLGAILKGSETAESLSNAYNAIIESLLQLVNVRYNIVESILKELNEFEDFQAIIDKISQMPLVGENYAQLLADLNSSVDSQRHDAKMKINLEINKLKEQTEALEFFIQICKFANFQYDLHIQIKLDEFGNKNNGNYTLKLTKPIFSYDEVVLPEQIQFQIIDTDVKEAFKALGLADILEKPMVKSILDSELPQFERLIELSRRLNTTDKGKNIEFILRKFFGFMYNVSGRATKRSVDVKNYEAIIVEAIRYHIDLYSDNNVNITKRLASLLEKTQGVKRKLEDGDVEGEEINANVPRIGGGGPEDVEQRTNVWEGVFTPYDAFYDAINDFAKQDTMEFDDFAKEEKLVTDNAAKLFALYNIPNVNVLSGIAMVGIYRTLAELRYDYFMVNDAQVNNIEKNIVLPVNFKTLEKDKAINALNAALDEAMAFVNVDAKTKTSQIAPEHIGLLQEFILRKWHKALQDAYNDLNNSGILLERELTEEDAWNVFFGKESLSSFSKKDVQTTDPLPLQNQGGGCPSKKNSLLKHMRSLNRDYYHYTSTKAIRVMLLKRTIRHILKRQAAKHETPSIF